MKFNKKISGYTLIEVIIALGVVLGLSVAAFFAYQPIKTKGQVKETVEMVRLIRSNITGTYDTSTGYSGLNNATIIAAGWLPEKWPVEGSAIKNNWGGGMNISASMVDTATMNCTATGVKCDHYRIVINEVPSAACADLALQLSIDFPIVAMAYVGGGETLQFFKDANNPNIDVAAVTDYCSRSSKINVRVASK